MPQSSFRRSLIVVIAALLGVFTPVERSAAQLPTESEFAGTIRSPAGDPVQRAVITLHDATGRVVRSFEGGLDGTFTVRGVGMGRYDVRVEALGFRPGVVTGVTLRPGETTRLAVVLQGGGAGVDTVAASGAGGTRAVERWIDAPDLLAHPATTPTLDSWLALSTTMGEGLGMAGLPGTQTSIFIDGLPFHPVFPLGLRESDRALGIVTARSTAAVQVGPGLDGFTLPAGAGGRVAVHTVRGGEMGGGLDGAASDGGTSDIRTVLGGASASITSGESGTRVALGADGWRAPQDRGVAAFARFDHPVEGGTVWGTGRLAVQPATDDDLGRAWGVVDTGERVDLLVGGGLVAPVGRREVLDVRVGLARSAWSSGLDASPDPVPATIHVEAANRLDANLIGTMVMVRGDHRFQFGARGGFTTHLHDPGTALWTADRSIRPGAGEEWLGPFENWRYRGKSTATVPHVGATAEDRWAVGPEVELRLGAAFDTEWIPILDVFPNSDWFEMSGLRALAREEQISGVSAFGELVWGGGTGTEFRAGGSYESHPFDPSLVMEILGSVDNELTWALAPGTSLGSGWAPTVAYLAKDPSAPSTTRLSAGFTHGAGPIEVALGGLFRYSDGLTRRRNLNRPVAPHGVDQQGRPLWAQPLKFGAWLGPDLATASRFERWGPVMELDQGGWSEYFGVTGRLTWRTASGVRVSGEYTWSRTEDNVPGIGAQGVYTGVPFEAEDGVDATAGISDLDRPHRVTGQVVIPLPLGDNSRLAAVWRFMSGAPFTPGYTPGVDANFDGVVGNDPAYVTSNAAAAHGEWSCLRSDAGSFATRNGCRRADTQNLDLRLEIGIARSGVGLFVDVFNVLDEERSLLDTALLGVDPGAGAPTLSGATALPFVVNPGFGSALVDRSTGRVLRVGLRVLR